MGPLRKAKAVSAFASTGGDADGASEVAHRRSYLPFFRGTFRRKSTKTLSVKNTNFKHAARQKSADSNEPRFILAGRELSRREHCHICAFFSSLEEKRRILSTFIRDGFDAGERAVHVIAPTERSAHRAWLVSEGIDTDNAEKCGQLDIRSWTETHFVDGKFDQVDTFTRFQRVIEQAQGARIRFITAMEWALEDPSIPDALLEYEARTNFLWRDQTRPINPVICAYDLRRFSGATVIDVLRTHPLIILGGILQENPFYIPPEEILAELKTRRLKSSE